MKRMMLALFAALALASTECSKSSDTAVAMPGGAETHGAVAVKPGSHEDWCSEHAVPESLCSRCHPELAAAFKATNDWCEEHGLPESHCLKCNPKLQIVRPPKGS